MHASRKSGRATAWAMAVCAAWAALPAEADTSNRRTVSRPGGFATVCAGYMQGSYVAGDSVDRSFTALHVCDDRAFQGDGQAQAETNYVEFGRFNDAGQARADMGTINIVAQHVGSNPGGFPTAVAVGGWSDTLTFVDPARTGQAGQFSFDLELSGFLSAAGPQGFARFQLFAARDGAASVWVNSDVAQSTFVGDDDFTPIQRTLTVVTPFEFGKPLAIDIYASVLAGSRSANILALESTSVADFFSTVRWGGITDVSVDGQPQSAYTLLSASGVDWRAAIPAPIPEPSTTAMLALGAVFLAWAGAAQRRPARVRRRG